MEILGTWIIGSLVVFVINALIFRFFIGTDHIMHYQRRQIRLLQQLLERMDIEPDNDVD